jgi:hypothetical protein
MLSIFHDQLDPEAHARFQEWRRANQDGFFLNRKTLRPAAMRKRSIVLSACILAGVGCASRPHPLAQPESQTIKLATERAQSPSEAERTLPSAPDAADREIRVVAGAYEGGLQYDHADSTSEATPDLEREGAESCDPNYSPCVPIDDDVDCANGRGNGPSYVDGPVEVIGSDIYDLDRDGDGVACER